MDRVSKYYQMELSTQVTGLMGRQMDSELRHYQMAQYMMATGQMESSKMASVLIQMAKSTKASGEKANPMVMVSRHGQMVVSMKVTGGWVNLLE